MLSTELLISLYYINGCKVTLFKVVAQGLFYKNNVLFFMNQQQNVLF